MVESCQDYSEETALSWGYEEGANTLIADKMLQQAHALGQSVVVAWCTQCRATHTDKKYLYSDHKKADTKLILFAADATASCETSIMICSPNSRKKE